MYISTLCKRAAPASFAFYLVSHTKNYETILTENAFGIRTSLFRSSIAADCPRISDAKSFI